MKRLASARLMLIIALLATLVSSSLGAAAPAPSAAPGQAPAPSAAGPAPDRVEAALDSAPLMFIENVGQFDPRARFQVRGGERTIWLAEDALWVTALETRPQISHPAYPREVDTCATLGSG